MALSRPSARFRADTAYIAMPIPRIVAIATAIGTSVSMYWG